jgi:uncharacterized membrane protein/mono/diheme cytochrome c family protein
MWNRVAVVYCAVAMSGPVAAAAPERDLGTEVRDLFAAKCAACHGPELAKPKGRFGYVTDLRRVAANPEMVIPGRPDESELWGLVQRDEMPPDKSPTGPLTAEQKEVVRAWIAAGAPAAISAAADPPAEEPAPPSPGDRTLRWIGKFHLLALHFPIALVIAAAIAEALSVWRRSAVPSDTGRFCLVLAAVTAVPTAVLGWLHAAAGNGVGSPQLLMAHRWLGTSTAVWIVLTAVVAWRDARRGTSRHMRVMLVVAVLLTMLTAHLGGLLDRGVDFFDW